MDPVTIGIPALAAGINTSIRILDVSYQLKAVGEQTSDLLETTRHVNNNVDEAVRLRRLKASCFSVDDRSWMDRVISDTKTALLEVARLIEPARVETMTTESIGPKTRMLWVFRDSSKASGKHNRLSLCQTSLMTVIVLLQSKVAPLPPDNQAEGPPPYNSDMEAMFNFHSRRRLGKKSTNPRSENASPDPQSLELDSQVPALHNPRLNLSDLCLAPAHSALLRPRSATSEKSEAMSAAAALSSPPSFDGAEGLQVQGTWSTSFRCTSVPTKR